MIIQGVLTRAQMETIQTFRKHLVGFQVLASGRFQRYPAINGRLLPAAGLRSGCLRPSLGVFVFVPEAGG